ncbi:hypothetical protein [Granulicoccus phenolivorans]|uniref:hypothetical protein n=1 Tax=Granulicoccus phenolivorans TaxID=266854 RepID=UPI00041D4B9E|nr:hypothetical protein [Granulicoccus phenolivorans]
MSRAVVIAIYVVAMVGTILTLDVVVFRDHLWPRLAANVGVVLLFGAFYFRYAVGS